MDYKTLSVPIGKPFSLTYCLIQNNSLNKFMEYLLVKLYQFSKLEIIRARITIKNELNTFFIVVIIFDLT
jgi:hypothetical protein